MNEIQEWVSCAYETPFFFSWEFKGIVGKCIAIGGETVNPAA